MWHSQHRCGAGARKSMHLTPRAADADKHHIETPTPMTAQNGFAAASLRRRALPDIRRAAITFGTRPGSWHDAPGREPATPGTGDPSPTPSAPHHHPHRTRPITRHMLLRGPEHSWTSRRASVITARVANRVSTRAAATRRHELRAHFRNDRVGR